MDQDVDVVFVNDATEDYWMVLVDGNPVGSYDTEEEAQDEADAILSA